MLRTGFPNATGHLAERHVCEGGWRKSRDIFQPAFNGKSHALQLLHAKPGNLQFAHIRAQSQYRWTRRDVSNEKRPRSRPLRKLARVVQNLPNNPCRSARLSMLLRLSKRLRGSAADLSLLRRPAAGALSANRH